MITAKELSEISVFASETIKKNSQMRVIQWCEDCEKQIIESANKGQRIAYLGVPQSVLNDFFSRKDRDAVIIAFFKEYGFSIRFQNGFIVDW